MSETKRPHLSKSQLEMFARCPEQWRRRYVEKDIVPPGIALMQGTGVHEGIALNMRQKIDTHADLPASEITDMAVESFKASVAGGCSLSDEEESRGADIVLGEAIDTVADLATVHAEQQAPDYQPVLVEQTVRISLPVLTHDLLGVIDVADDKDRIVDFKTANRAKSQADAEHSIQLSVYGASYVALTGRNPSELRLDTLVKLKRGAARSVVSTTRTDADYRALAHRVSAVANAILAGVFPPAMPGSWWCSSKFCGYWRTCKYVNGERRSAAGE